MFDLSIPKLLVLAVIALIIFGPNELPKIASQAGRALRDLRKIAEGAKNDLREGLGPEFSDFDIEDLNPKRFVQKHLLDDINGDSADRSPGATGGQASPGATGGQASPANQATARQARANGTLLAPGERPPYDIDST
ncbi:MAG TPA: sec-independent translocase [Streptosporangiaceae bacterium]